MAGEQKQLDTTIEVVTPENIAFHYQVAGPFRRLPAFMIDIALKVFILTVLWIGGWLLLLLIAVFLPGLRTFIVELLGMYQAAMLLVIYVMNWYYGVFFETYWNGQTPGKYALSIRVLTTTGQPINGMQAMLRNLTREVEMVLMVFGLGIMSSNPRFQRLGDLASGTIVVVEERQWLVGLVKLEDPRAAQLASYIPTDFVIHRSLAKSLAAYVDRRRFFSPLRRKEIAKHLGDPLLRYFGMPQDTSHDLLLCALYYRAFVSDLGEDPTPVPAASTSPFAVAAAGIPGIQQAASAS